MGLEEIVSFTPLVNLPSRAVMERVGMITNPDEDFDHPNPALPDGSELKRMCLYRLGRETFRATSGLEAARCWRFTRNVRLDQLGQRDERLLPAQVAHLDGNHLGDAFLHDGHARCRTTPAVSVTVVFMVPGRFGSSNARVVGDALAGHQLQVLAAERVAVAGAKVGEGHAPAPPTTGSMLWTLPVKPKGGSQRSKASGSTKAR